MWKTTILSCDQPLSKVINILQSETRMIMEEIETTKEAVEQKRQVTEVKKAQNLEEFLEYQNSVDSWVALINMGR